jgi:uncharacterized protein YjiS (DUF1127 family)
VSKMHSFEIRQSCQTSGGFLGTAMEALRAFADKIAHGHQQHCDYLQLSAMSEPELQDIGISRSDISAVLSGTYRRGERPPLKANDRIGLGVRPVAAIATEGEHHAPSIRRNSRQRNRHA